MPPRLRHNSIPLTSSLSLPPSQICLFQSRCLSVTATAAAPRPAKKSALSQRSEFFNWINGPGTVFKQADDDGPKYLSSYKKLTWERKDPTDSKRSFVMPYPMNKSFISQPVLSNQMRDEIYRRVEISGMSVRQVSADLAVSLERVAAVVRLKAVEKKWKDEGKHISTYLTGALEKMLPVTHFVLDGSETREQGIHENIQEIPSHPFAARQAFVPTSESREYTRVDAGKEFGLPPADEVVPHPELVVLKREKIENLSQDELGRRQKERDRLAKVQMEEKEARALEKARTEGKIVEQGRWKWKLKEVKAGNVGFRYGYPHPDRKKGHVKIPTHVI